MMKTSILIHISPAAICILGVRLTVRAFYVESELTFALAVTAISFYSLCMLFNAVNGIYRAYDLCTDRRKSAYILTVLNFFVMPIAAMLIISALCKPQNIRAAYAVGHGLVTVAATGKVLSDWRKLHCP